MTEKKKIIRRYPFNIRDSKVSDAIEILEDIKARFGDYTFLNIEIEESYGVESIEQYIEYDDIETDIEMRNRLKLEAVRADYIAKRDAEEYERLKKKFG